MISAKNVVYIDNDNYRISDSIQICLQIYFGIQDIHRQTYGDDTRSIMSSKDLLYV